MRTLDDFLKELEEYIPQEYDCEACEFEAKGELVKHRPRHTCGKDGPVPDINEQKKKLGD